MSRDRSPSSSPARKRQRLSSPFYDEQLGDISDDYLEAVDAFEASLSQSLQLARPDPKQGQGSIAFSASPSFSLASAQQSGRKHAIFEESEAVHDLQPSSSPEEPQEQNFDDWFKPLPANFSSEFTDFTSALHSNNPIIPALGFAKASNKGLITPSSEALARAKQKMNNFWREVNIELGDAKSPKGTTSSDTGEGAFKTASSLIQHESPDRPPLRPNENTYNSPQTPTPAYGFSSARKIDMSSPPMSDPKNSIKPFRPPLLSRPVAKEFRTPFRNNTAMDSPSKRQTPHSNKGTRLAHPLAAEPISAAARHSSNRAAPFATPIRSSHNASHRQYHSPSTFVTPFKEGMKPGQPGRLLLEKKWARTTQTPQPVRSKVDSNGPVCSKGNGTVTGTEVFDLTPPKDRQLLFSSGLRPQQHTSDELEEMGICVAELERITPDRAIHYSFHTFENTPHTGPDSFTEQLGTSAALDHLLKRGCGLATKPWVDNHWGLILWKLAGMVALDPATEQKPERRRWCWNEVLRQLLYRYQREMYNGIRPPFRLITTHDAPAACSMALCISNISWPSSSSPEGLPELEVTDGWYRLRAQIDPPIARAVKKGKLCVGRKIGVVAARLFSERKEPAEVLEAYGWSKLILSGNSTHLVPWYTKLGFHREPWISTLHSLTPDGGIIALMDIVITKAYPVAFFEFVQEEDGRKRREGPRSEGEEAQLEGNWKKRREKAISQLTAKVEDKWKKYEGYVDRLQKKAGSAFIPNEDDYPSSDLEVMYEELGDPEDANRVITSCTPTMAGWLAQHIQRQMDNRRLNSGDEIEDELKSLCPPREVRSFRILLVEDARTARRLGNRHAQLTAWDVLKLSFDQDSPAGNFAVGQRYLVTNLMPTQQTAWMGHEPGSEVFLSTRRDTRWTPIKT